METEPRFEVLGAGINLTTQSASFTKHLNTFHKQVIILKEGLHQRTENRRMYKISGPDKSLCVG